MTTRLSFTTLRLPATFVPVALWLLLIPSFLFNGDRVSGDSADFIDCARSIVQGRGFQTRTYMGLDSRLWIPFRLWPPGYPLLIAASMSAGLKPQTAALAVSVCCSTIFLILVCGFYARRLPAIVAAFLGLTLVCIPCLLHVSTVAWSEPAYLLFSAASLFSLMRANTRDGMSRLWLLSAGAFGGISWCIRNAAVALFAASISYLAFQLVARVRFRDIAGAAALWMTGWLTTSFWLVIRNITVFGTLIPYILPPSDVSFLENCRSALRAFLNREFCGVYPLVAIAVVAAVGIGPRFWRRRWPEFVESLQRNRDELLLGLFGFLHLLTVLIAASTYRWNVIDQRHFSPIYWIALFCLTSLSLQMYNRLLSRPKMAKVVIATAVGLAGALQFAILQARYPICAPLGTFTGNGERGGWTSSMRNDADALATIIPNDTIVLSDRATELRVFGNVNARLLKPWPGESDAVPLTWREIATAAEGGLLWGIVAIDRESFIRGRYGSALQDIARGRSEDTGFRKREAGTGMLVLQYVGGGRLGPQVGSHTPGRGREK